jgi:hypothetical protein
MIAVWQLTLQLATSSYRAGLAIRKAAPVRWLARGSRI